jgi:hypothetical protein
MGENFPIEDEKLKAYSSIMCNLWNIHHAMFPPSFGEKNEKLNSNMSLGVGGRKPLTQMATPKEKTPWQAKKKNTKKLQRKKIAPKKQGKTRNKQKEK